MKKILRRAFEEGREGRVLMMQARLDSAREMPEEHARILRQLKLFGQTVPEGGLFSNRTLH
ncbi:MAG: hypothetical protein H6853_06160 [Rhodospirillales bacterium]|nr:hypothetical protein [Alphaproteobacteria bacterium]USO03122.1 MAG: hypothetical protein H6853_06160 [Rhodospirillales bacterium]